MFQSWLAIDVPWAHGTHVIAQHTHSMANGMQFILRMTVHVNPLHFCLEAKTKYVCDNCCYN